MWDPDDADGDDLAARARLRGGEAHLRRPRPAFRPVRRRGAKSDPRARAHPGRHARRQRPRHHSGLLRRREGTAGRHQGRSQGAQSHAGGISRPGRPQSAGRREGPHADRADRDAPDRRDQRHHRRLYRRGRQDRHPGAGHGEGVVPPGRRRRTRRKSATPSAPSSARGCRPTARSSSRTSAGAPAIAAAVRQSGARQDPRRARRTNGARRR